MGNNCGEDASVSEWLPDHIYGRMMPRWVCAGHAQLWRERPDKLLSIDRQDPEKNPAGISDHVRLSMIAAKFAETRQSPQPPQPTGIVLRRQQRWTKQQWANHQAMIESAWRAQDIDR